MPRGCNGLALVLLSVAVLGACSAPPKPAPAPSPPPINRYGAPAVTEPRSVDGIAAAPCTYLLANAELRLLGFTKPGRERPFLGVTECSWDAANGQNLRIYADASHDLLADTYRTQRGGYFQPTVIEGMPAVRQKSGIGEFNYCTITTGLGPMEALETTWNGVSDPRPGNDACDFAEQATALVIRKLPPQR
jgi:hypothetical protein